MISFKEGRGPGAKKAAARVLSLRLVITGTQPRVWRRLLVLETMWLSRLHDSIQIAFEWFDYQTHVFAFGDLRFGNPLKQEGLIVEDDRDVTLGEMDLEHHARFVYSYNFDEGWQVEITVEKPPPSRKGARYPLCAAGERAGPPEDCGGPEAYHDMLACLKEPTTDLGREWREWLGPDYEPEACDVAKLNQALRRLGK